MYSHAQNNQQERNDRLIAAAGSFLFAVGILLILFLVIIYTPNPPFPEGGGGGGGIELSFGNSVDGMGDVNPDELSGTALPTAPVPVEDNAITQDVEDDAPGVSNEPNKIKNTTPVPPQKVSNTPLFSKKGGQEGTSGKPGNQGEPNGTAPYKGGGGKGTGPGKGGGNGDGDGDGNGPGKGSGTGTDGSIGLKILGISRGANYTPKPQKSNKEGFVVVNIIVDENGKVVSASQGKGTTLNDSQAIKNAIAAARATTFKVKAGADDEVGTITYQFKF